MVLVGRHRRELILRSTIMKEEGLLIGLPHLKHLIIVGDDLSFMLFVLQMYLDHFSV